MRVRLFVRRHRRGLAFLLGCTGVLLALSALRQPEPHWLALVAARDLPAGHQLAPDDLVQVPVTTAAHPRSAATDRASLVGRSLASDVDEGEVLIERRLAGQGLLAGAPEGHVAITVRVDDFAEVAFLRPGDRVDVLAASRASEVSGPSRAAEVVASGVPVLAVPDTDPVADSGLLQSPVSVNGANESPSILVAVPADTAEAIAGAAVNSRLSVVLRDAAP